MKYPKLLILTAVAVLCGCTEVIDFDPGEASKKPVLVSRPTHDSKVNVYLNYSRFFLDNSNYSNGIADATMTLRVNGTDYAAVYDPNAESYAGKGCYRFSYVPQPGDTLRITANIPDEDEPVTATTNIPQVPSFEVADYVIDTFTTYQSEYGYYYETDDAVRLRIKVKSQSNDEFFRLRIYKTGYYTTQGATEAHWDTNWTTVYFTCNDPLVNTYSVGDILGEEESGFYGDEMTFSSELFQNGEHEFTIDFSVWINSTVRDIGLDISAMPLRIELQSLSRDLYRYTLTTEQQDNLDELFGEPVQVMSNITGGLGVFGGYSTKVQKAGTARFEHFSNRTQYYK